MISNAKGKFIFSSEPINFSKYTNVNDYHFSEVVTEENDGFDEITFELMMKMVKETNLHFHQKSRLKFTKKLISPKRLRKNKENKFF